ncbi:MAG: 4-(cytidine 5'-diphospho)-2-C-methyl-D-erythritol kinase [Hydrogenophaga sp.]|jgi:4-diphosphocytidyl-2-C-methyl-D-erythritol kinase
MTPPDHPVRELTGLPAPAKLNLFLHITGRRADGYHLLQSVFMLVDWQDTIDLVLREDGQLSREDSGTRLALPDNDLCVRAADALRQATGCTLGAHIRLHKQIPAEAGMGGGSSDAATCLIGLNRLWHLGLARAELARIGLALGADVPFFIGGHNAWVEGVGEQLTPVHLPRRRFVVVKPPTGASTPKIFASPALKRDTKTATMQGFAADENAEAMLDMEKLFAHTRNDLQPVAQGLCPDIERCILWLFSQGLQGRMTGSGSAVFAPLPDAFDALAPLPEGWVARICSSLDAHPLTDWISG